MRKAVQMSAFVLIISAMMVGCNITVRRNNGGSVETKDGVAVDVGETGIHVNAGDTKVDIGGGDGIQVDAGDTKVDVDFGSINVETNGSSEKETKSYSEQENSAESIDSMSVEFDMGNITVAETSGSKITYSYDVEVSGARESSREEIIEKITAAPKIEGSMIEFITLVEGIEEDLGDYMNSNYPNYTASVSLDVKVPSSISRFDLESDMGNICIDDVAGRMTVYSDMGNIEANDVTFEGSCELTTDMGNVDVTLDSGDIRKADVELATDMGNVSLDMDGLNASKEWNDDFMSDEADIVVEDMIHIHMATDMGNVEID